MELLRKYSLRDIVKLAILLKYFTYIFLVWNLKCDMSTFGKSSGMIYEQDGSLNIRFNRLLAKHELKNDSYKTYTRQKYGNYGMNKNIKSEEVKKSTYSEIRGGGLNKFDAYMKDYKNRYAKKNGIAKLDCYYENKIFNKIKNIYEISKNMKTTKKYYNKKKYNKYVTLFVPFAIIPFLRLIFILYFSDLNPNMKEACFSECLFKHDASGKEKYSSNSDSADGHKKNGGHLLSFDKNTYEKIEIVNDVFLWLSFSIVLLVLLYILIKVIKYARIKSGKCKIV